MSLLCTIYKPKMVNAPEGLNQALGGGRRWLSAMATNSRISFKCQQFPLGLGNVLSPTLPFGRESPVPKPASNGNKTSQSTQPYPYPFQITKVRDLVYSPEWWKYNIQFANTHFKLQRWNLWSKIKSWINLAGRGHNCVLLLWPRACGHTGETGKEKTAGHLYRQVQKCTSNYEEGVA